MSIVTAVIPCYNAAAFLSETIDSVKAQTVPLAEILVIDDGSGDDSPRIAREAGARVLATGGQLGAATARNIGAREARTPYLAFLDADDQWLPQHCELLLKLLEQRPEAAVAFGRIQKFGATGNIATPRREAVERRDGAGLPELLHDNPIAQSAAIVDRSRLLEAGGYREDLRFAEDYDLWLRLAERHAILACNTVTCRYRVHTEQISHALPAMIQCGWDARLTCRARLLKLGTFDERHGRMLLEALEDDARSAWMLGDRESLELLLELAGQIEGASRLQRSIRARIHLLPLRRVALGLKRLGKP
jgi:glycosyltransferase involved in cell wall biosynthesis